MTFWKPEYANIGGFGDPTARYPLGEEHMKEEWLFPGAVVPVDVETTAALVAEIKRLIDVVGGMALAQPEQNQQIAEMQDWEAIASDQAMTIAMMMCEQEPVQEDCDCVTRQSAENAISYMTDANSKGREIDAQAMLVSAPLPVQPERQWVSLTGEELLAIVESDDCDCDLDIAILVQAKLKEKNT